MHWSALRGAPGMTAGGLGHRWIHFFLHRRKSVLLSMDMANAASLPGTRAEFLLAAAVAP